MMGVCYFSYGISKRLVMFHIFCLCLCISPASMPLLSLHTWVHFRCMSLIASSSAPQFSSPSSLSPQTCPDIDDVHAASSSSDDPFKHPQIRPVYTKRRTTSSLITSSPSSAFSFLSYARTAYSCECYTANVCPRPLSTTQSP
jgi:hypothetical protein